MHFFSRSKRGIVIFFRFEKGGWFAVSRSEKREGGGVATIGLEESSCGSGFIVIIGVVSMLVACVVVIGLKERFFVVLLWLLSL